MSTEPAAAGSGAGGPEHRPRRRVAVVLAHHGAQAAAPPGLDPAAFALACLADCYEVVAELDGVRNGIAGPDSMAELLWPGAILLEPGLALGQLAEHLADQADELVVVPADLPDLPALVLAKIFKVLHRVDVAVAPEQGGPGCAAIGVALPLGDWIDPGLLDLELNPFAALVNRAPHRSRCVLTPAWHRLRTATDVSRLDPRLEGWEETRALLGAY